MPRDTSTSSETSLHRQSMLPRTNPFYWRKPRAAITGANSCNQVSSSLQPWRRSAGRDIRGNQSPARRSHALVRPRPPAGRCSEGWAAPPLCRTLENWTQRPCDSPPARGIHAMTYDVAPAVCSAAAPGVSILGDTWQWDGGNWTRRLSAPTASARATTRVRPRARRTVLFGGVDSRFSAPETWAGPTTTPVMSRSAPAVRAARDASPHPAAGTTTMDRRTSRSC